MIPAIEVVLYPPSGIGSDVIGRENGGSDVMLRTYAACSGSECVVISGDVMCTRVRT